MGTTWIERSATLFTERRRCVEHGRLVYYHQAADAAFWDSQWKALLSPEYYKSYLAGNLDELERPFTRHLPKQGKILEAGCGVGQMVAALRSHGYDCVGADFAQETVAAVHEILPDLPIVVADITRLDGVAAGEFAGVISLGVVEHRQAGPEPFLDEAWRILAHGGILLISVPTFNGLRRWRASRGAYRDEVAGMDFFQYAFRSEEFCGYLTAAGFRVIAEYPYDPRTGLGEEMPFMRRAECIPLLAKIVYRCASHLPRSLHEFMSHMRLFAAEKVERVSHS